MPNPVKHFKEQNKEIQADAEKFVQQLNSSSHPAHDALEGVIQRHIKNCMEVGRLPVVKPSIPFDYPPWIKTLLFVLKSSNEIKHHMQEACKEVNMQVQKYQTYYLENGQKTNLLDEVVVYPNMTDELTVYGKKLKGRRKAPKNNWWNSTSVTYKTTTKLFAMDNWLGYAEWNTYAATKIGEGHTNFTFKDNTSMTTTYTFAPSTNSGFYYTAESATFGVSGQLITIGISLKNGTLYSKIGNTNIGIENTYQPTQEAVVVIALVLSAVTGNFETYPILLPNLTTVPIY